MTTIRFGGSVYGPGLFMSNEEAALVKQELLARGTKTALRLASEIGMPSEIAYAGEKKYNRVAKAVRESESASEAKGD